MKLDYQIVYSDRKTVSLTVERDSSVVVRAPKGLSEEKIHQAVESKKLWLYEKINHKQKYPSQTARKEFVSGETLLYLGKNYRLEVTNDEVHPARELEEIGDRRDHVVEEEAREQRRLLGRVPLAKRALDFRPRLVAPGTADAATRKP